LGNGKKKAINVAVQIGDEPRVWVDENNDQDLCNDEGGKPDSYECRTVLSFKWYFEVQVSYEVNGQSIRQPYYLTILASREKGPNKECKFHYVSGGLRKGLIDIGGALYDIYIGDRNSDGLYNDDFRNLTVLIDVNHDGKIAWDNSVYEVFTFSSDPDFPIQVGPSIYSVKSVTPDGRRLVIEKVGEAPSPSVLTVGHPAPDFTAKTVGGESLSLSDYRGKITVLIPVPFQCYERFSSCKSCSSREADTLQRALDLQEYVGSEPDRLREKIALIGVSAASEPPSSSLLEKFGIEFPVVWDQQLAQLYRWSDLLVLDQEGNIQLTGDYIVKLNGERITEIQYCWLDAWTIEEEIERLLR
jgi:peroxiredoxin